MTDPLTVIQAAIPVGDDGCTIIGASRYQPDDIVIGAAGNYPLDQPGQYQNPLYGHPSTVAALIRDALDGAGLLLTDEHRGRIEQQARAHERRRVRAILGGIHFQYRTAWTDEFDTCAGCNRGMELVPWPCATWKKLNELTGETT